MSRKNVEGRVYLLHFDQKIGNQASKYGTAQHYTGWASDLDARLAEHAAGHGSKLMSAVKAAGISWHVSRTWTGTRARERQLKIQGGASRRCPDCKTEKEQNAVSKQAKVMVGDTPAPKTTVGELARGVAAGTWTRERAAEAISKLEVIHWSAEVERPQPEPEIEMG